MAKTQKILWSLSEPRPNKSDAKYIPSPAQILGKETSCYGSNDGSEQRTHSPDRHGATSLLRRHHISNRAGSIGEGCDANGSSQESKADEHVHVCCKCAGDGEYREESVADVVDEHAAEHLTERRYHERTHCKAKNVDGDDECRQRLPERDVSKMPSRRSKLGKHTLLCQSPPSLEAHLAQTWRTQAG